MVEHSTHERGEESHDIVWTYPSTSDDSISYDAAGDTSASEQYQDGDDGRGGQSDGDVPPVSNSVKRTASWA